MLQFTEARAGMDAFDQGLRAFRAGDTTGAAERLSAFIVARPKDRRAAEAQFYVAEAHFAEANFPQAIVEYQKVLDMYPASSKRPDALYGIGLSYYELNFFANALAHFEKLVQEHPESGLVDEARPLIERARRRLR